VSVIWRGVWVGEGCVLSFALVDLDLDEARALRERLASLATHLAYVLTYSSRDGLLGSW